MKILYCINSIQNIGGIEKVTLTKANALSSAGFEVSIAVTDHNHTRPLYLSNKVTLYDLKINYYKDDWKSFLHRLKGFVIKRKIHKKRLRSLLNKINPDIVISVGQSEKYFLPKLKGHWKTIREFHYDKMYRIRSSNSLYQRLIAKISNFYEFNFVLNKYDQIIVLTKEDKENNWKNNSKIINIPNPLTVAPSVLSSLNNNKVIAVGRLEHQKNFQSLINAYKLIASKYKDWSLEIWGEGSLKEDLQKLIENLELKDYVKLKGGSLDTSKVYCNADILALTSLYEGWGLVLTEAMAFGIPVVSYETPCGPKDIITDGYNGYLVPLNDELLLAKKIIQLMGNCDLRKKMGLDAKLKSEDYKIDNIIKQWIDLFNKLYKE